MNDWIQTLFSDPDMLEMGHGQRSADGNLGAGFVYYGLARAMRPTRALVIGSWRGFVPLVLGKALLDNAESGEVLFIDPSLVDDFWTDAARVTEHFCRFGVTNVRHFPMTTQAFAASEEFASLKDIGLLFIDGLHTAEQVRYDYEAFLTKLTSGAVVIFHDSHVVRTSRIYGDDRPYEQRVKDLMDSLRQDPSLDLLDLPVGNGFTILRRRSKAQ
ncbi:MAG: class I SAM-dependent methyltransferase [Vicinamibacteria bacterium]